MRHAWCSYKLFVFLMYAAVNAAKKSWLGAGCRYVPGGQIFDPTDVDKVTSRPSRLLRDLRSQQPHLHALFTSGAQYST